MHIMQLKKYIDHADPISREAATLIDAIGTSSFDGRLKDVVERAIGQVTLNAFIYSGGIVSDFILAVNDDLDGSSVKRMQKYSSNYWYADPAHRVLATSEKMEGGVLVHLPPDEMKLLDYRRELYSLGGWAAIGDKLVERVTIMTAHEAGTLRFGFYRRKDAGCFEPKHLKTIHSAANLLFSLATKHHEHFSLNLDTEAKQSRNISRLRKIAPSLTQRELEVCAGISVGLSSEAIALRLGVKLNTVLTHRKHSYARLGISSQNELISRVFEG